MQVKRVQSLVCEDSTSLRATKPMHSYWSLHALEPMVCNRRSHHKWEACTPQGENSPCSLQWEKVHTQQQTPRIFKERMKQSKKKRNEKRKRRQINAKKVKDRGMGGKSIWPQRGNRRETWDVVNAQYLDSGGEYKNKQYNYIQTYTQTHGHFCIISYKCICIYNYLKNISI